MSEQRAGHVQDWMDEWRMQAKVDRQSEVQSEVAHKHREVGRRLRGCQGVSRSIGVSRSEWVSRSSQVDQKHEQEQSGDQVDNQTQ